MRAIIFILASVILAPQAIADHWTSAESTVDSAKQLSRTAKRLENVALDLVPNSGLSAEAAEMARVATKLAAEIDRNAYFPSLRRYMKARGKFQRFSEDWSNVFGRRQLTRLNTALGDFDFQVEHLEYEFSGAYEVSVEEVVSRIGGPGNGGGRGGNGGGRGRIGGGN